MTEYKVTETGKILVSEVEPNHFDATAPEEGIVNAPISTEVASENRKRILEEMLLTQIGMLRKYLFMKGYDIYVDGYSILDSNHITVWTIDNGVVMDLTHQLPLEPTDKLFVSSISKVVQCIIKEQIIVDKQIIGVQILK